MKLSTTSEITKNIIDLAIFLAIQIDGYQWRDRWPLIYTNWLVPGELHLPVRHLNSNTIRYMHITTGVPDPISAEFVDSIKHQQPYPRTPECVQQWSWIINITLGS